MPLLYSIVSLGGVVLLLVSTPLGFTKMFGIVSELAQVIYLVFMKNIFTEDEKLDIERE